MRVKSGHSPFFLTPACSYSSMAVTRVDDLTREKALQAPVIRGAQ